MRLSDAQLEVLRSQPQSTELFLSIFEPQIIFQAQVNEPNAHKGQRRIDYDNVSLGDYTAIENGFTAWVGTTLGDNDLGVIRVRSATSSRITVSENSSIDWQNNAYITVFRYVELWPIYPRIIIDPANVENTIWYKDFDIDYTNQNNILGTYINMGPHRAMTLDPATGQGQIYYSSTGSLNLRNSNLSYEWFFEGATVTGSNAADPGWITYNTPGHYTTRLIISGSLGQVDTSYRYVSIYNESNPPILKWQLNQFSGSRDEGGYIASFKVFQIIPLQEHAVVVLYKKSTYGTNQINLGGNFPNASDIFFSGYIDRDSIQYDYEHSEVSFDAVSITNLMKDSAGFSVSVQSVATPAYWYELRNMTGKRAIYHYLRWHTTAMMISDFQWAGDDYFIQFFDADRESMYDALNNYMRDTLVGQVVSDRQGKVWLEVEAMADTTPTATYPKLMDITNRDWMNAPDITERLSPEISFMEYGGVAFSGTVTGTFAALIGSAPGNTPDFHGSVENHQGLALSGQSQLNGMVGNIFANENSPFPEVSMEMAINASNFDIAPQETARLHIAQSDTVRNIEIDSLYLIDSMSWVYDPVGFSLLPQIDFLQLVDGVEGETVIIPISPETTPFEVPTLQSPQPSAFPSNFPLAVGSTMKYAILVGGLFNAGSGDLSWTVATDPDNIITLIGDSIHINAAGVYLVTLSANDVQNANNVSGGIYFDISANVTNFVDLSIAVKVGGYFANTSSTSRFMSVNDARINRFYASSSILCSVTVSGGETIFMAGPTMTIMKIRDSF